jgi:hypothetical protein
VAPVGDEVIARAIDAMTDVQRRSVHAASALVERLVAAVDGHDDTAGGTDAEAPRGDDPWDGFAKLWRDSMMSLAGAVAGDSAAPHIDVSAGPTPAPLRVALDAASASGSVEVWLHNPTAEPFDKLRVHCSVPQAHDGSSLDTAAIMVDPDAFDLPVRSSRGVQISVTAPGARPGTYRAMVLVDGLPDQWLPLEITVPAAP